MVTLTVILDIIIATGYITFALSVILVLGMALYHWAVQKPAIKRLKRKLIFSIVGSIMFFIGCAGSHIMMVHMYNEYPGIAEHMAVHMIPVQALQVVGVWGPTVMLYLVARTVARASEEAESVQEQRTKDTNAIVHDNNERLQNLEGHLEEELTDREGGVIHRKLDLDEHMEAEQERKDSRQERKEAKADREERNG